MGCSKKKFRTERSPSVIIPPITSLRPRMLFSSAVLLRTCSLRYSVLSTPATFSGGCRSIGIGSACAHDARKPARLREGCEHQDQKYSERCRQKRARSAKQPRPEDKPDEENRRREAKPPSHQHRRERVLCQHVDE